MSIYFVYIFNILLKNSKKLYAHIDCDSFFANCEILANPSLQGKYVCVGGDIIVATTYNAKRKGIKIGTPVWQAREMLPKDKTVFCGLSFELYNELSKKLMKYLEQNTLNLEKFSIDEAFCEITGLPELYKKSSYDYARALQKNIKEKIGIPVSIGVSNTRIKAKIFSDLDKPYGVYVGNYKEPEYERFKTIPFGEIPFAGRKTQKRFQYRCDTIHDFLNLGFWPLKREVGKHMTSLRLELHGVHAFSIDNKKAAKSISRSRSFNKTKTHDKGFLLQQILMHFETVYTWITEKSVEIGEIGVMLRDEDFKTHTSNYIFPEPTNDRKKMLEVLKQLFEQVYKPGTLYRSTGVNFYKLSSYLPKQLSLFDKEFRKKDSSYELSRTLNRINKKYDKQKVMFGKDLLDKELSERIFIRA